MIGQTIAHYRITEKLGEGGMGVVYRAHDTHLNRPAAIKVLRPEAMRDPERRRRFVQEAQAASALNHPNIITIYDIDRHEGVDYMAMEYIAGQTIDRLLGGSGLRAAEALKYAVQIADALTRAHAAGIVHRDLKPQNLMVTEDGLVKVLDFGLAKLTEPAGSDDRTATIEQVGRTEEGTIIGTVAYMSPEQAEGKKVDVRSDVFSFGCVLYEMISGRPAFTGESRISTLSAILHKEPAPLKDLAPDVPAELEQLVNRCLRKDLGRRAQHMGDLKILIEELKQDVDLGRLAPAAEPVVSRRRMAPLLAGGLALLILGVAAGWWASRSPAPAPGPQVTRLTSDSGLTTDPALSPDGKLLAFASDRSGEGNLDIWVRQVARSEPVRLTRDPADEYDPAFSPDGTQIAFRSEREGGAIYVMPALGGGEPRLLARGGRNPRFSPDGKWIAYWTGYGRIITAKAYVVPAAGGAPKQLLPDFHIVRHLTWSPDGKRLLFLGAREGGGSPQFDWWITASPEETSGSPVKTGAFDLFTRHGMATGISPVPADWTGDRVLFSATQGDSTNLWDVSISARNWQVAGAPRRLTFGVGPDSDPSAAVGRVVFSILSQNYDIWSLPIEGNQAKATGPLERLTQDAAPDDHASISADGKRIAFQSTRSGNIDIWVKDLETGKERALTMTPGNEGNPVISADGTRVAYGVQFSPTGSVDVVTFEGGVPERACNDCGAILNWFPDGKKLVSAGGPSRHVGLLDLATGRITTLLQHPTYPLFDTYPSPDGRWVAIHLLNSALTRQVFVAPLREDGPIPQSEWVQVTDGTRPDGFPNWSPDGNLLYLVSDRDGFRCLWAQRLEPATKRPAGAAFPVFHLHEASRSLASTLGNRPLSFAASRNRLVFTLNQSAGNIWMAEMSR